MSSSSLPIPGFVGGGKSFGCRHRHTRQRYNMVAIQWFSQM